MTCSSRSGEPTPDPHVAGPVRRKSYRARSCLTGGAADKVNRLSGGRMLAERMPNCDLYVVANTGHWVQWERAELFNRLCADFLAGRR